MKNETPSKKKNTRASSAGQSGGKSKPGGAGTRTGAKAGEARARGRGETAAANSSNPKERSPKQENL